MVVKIELLFCLMEMEQILKFMNAGQHFFIDLRIFSDANFDHMNAFTF